MPTGYSLLVQPEQYQTRNVRADSVTVLLLCDFTTTRPATGTQTQVAVFPVQMLWAEADWKVASSAPAATQACAPSRSARRRLTRLAGLLPRGAPMAVENCLLDPLGCLSRPRAAARATRPAPCGM